ncbi:MAG: zinc ribbon domain-containing protein [Corallincola sp.]|nr:zinc ribbon domain-containing protein [Corallincola sp.]
MALIACPACNKRISSRSSRCPACHCPLGEGDQERRDSHLRILRIQRQQRFMMGNALALLLFTGGAALTFWFGVDTPWLVTAGQVMMAIGLISYLGVRAWQIFSK